LLFVCKKGFQKNVTTTALSDFFFVCKQGVQKINDAVSMISDNYKGYAQMCLLTASLMQDVGVGQDARNVEVILREHLQTQLEKQFDPTKADEILTSTNPEVATISYVFCFREKKWYDVVYIDRRCLDLYSLFASYYCSGILLFRYIIVWLYYCVVTYSRTSLPLMFCVFGVSSPPCLVVVLSCGLLVL
jgi:hypothetical protein